MSLVPNPFCRTKRELGPLRPPTRRAKRFGIIDLSQQTLERSWDYLIYHNSLCSVCRRPARARLATVKVNADSPIGSAAPQLLTLPRARDVAVAELPPKVPSRDPVGHCPDRMAQQTPVDGHRNHGRRATRRTSTFVRQERSITLCFCRKTKGRAEGKASVWIKTAEAMAVYWRTMEI